MKAVCVDLDEGNVRVDQVESWSVCLLDSCSCVEMRSSSLKGT